MSKSKNTNKKRSSFLLILTKLFVGNKIADMTVDDERYDSPGKLAVKRFFRKPLAVGAVVVLVAMFAFVIIGPMIDPIDLSYSESLHANIAPTMSMMKIPAEMKEDPRSISSYGSFTVGVSKEGKVYTWGYYKASSDANNVMKVPDEVQRADILYAAAGFDHVIAIDKNGKIYGWGKSRNGQYGDPGPFADTVGHPQPKELITGNIDVANVKELICGNQVTAILMNDGTMYGWGNTKSSATNMADMLAAVENGERFDKLAFTNAGIFAISKDGRFVRNGNSQYQRYNDVLIDDYIGQRKVIDIASTGDSVVILLDDGELMAFGVEITVPVIPEGDSIASLMGGSRHFTLVTKNGVAISWGNGALGQTKVPASFADNGSADEVYAVGFQNYAFKDGKFVGSWGLKGYAMGTDATGCDIFNRVMNGGKMTMTIGAVAVIVSSIIGIIVGCISGYFGGIVDLLLMRVTEIFSAIPFLPFALVLSAILQGSSLHEDTRIFIIMIILGLLSWTGLATLVRGQILAEREKEFVTAAKSMGVNETRIAFKHILPNIISVILVSLTLSFASCMLTESSLSYLGFGVRLPRPTWGNMLNGCNNEIVIMDYWWRWLFPALFLSITVICINIIGDTLRDILDPKSEVEK